MRMNISKLAVGVAVVLATSLTTAQHASAVTIITFGQTADVNTVTASEVGGGTVISGSDIAIDITQMENSVGTISAFLTFTLTSVNTATDDGFGTLTQRYSGSFSITNGGTNYLSGTFTNGLFSGDAGAASATFSVAQPPQGLTFTENGPITSTAVPVSFALSFTNLNPALSLNLAGDSIAAFSASVSGNASGSAIPRDEVPEPGSMLLLGSGLMGLAAAARRRRQAKK